MLCIDRFLFLVCIAAGERRALLLLGSSFGVVMRGLCTVYTAAPACKKCACDRLLKAKQIQYKVARVSV